MASYRLLIFIAISATVLCHTIALCGPARSLALAAVRASSKIPREIRAPFRNTEMMTARGFGKRAQGLKDGNMSWNFGKKQNNNFLEELGVTNDSMDQMFNEQIPESFPIDWMATEMAYNPVLAKTILERFVDTDKNGFITANELLNIPVDSSTNNDIY